MTTTDGEAHGGKFLQVDSLEVAVLCEETNRNQLDLENFSKLFKPGNVAKLGGLFQLTHGGSTTSEWASISVLERRVRKLK